MTRVQGPSSQPVERYQSSGGRSVYRIRLAVFPGYYGSAYLIDDGDRPFLVDCGSGHEDSNRDLDRGFDLIRETFGLSLEYADLGAIVITHGHIDHFGGLGHLRSQTGAPIHVHRIDAPVIACYEERLVLAAKRVGRFLERAGVEAGLRERLGTLYLSMKELFRPLPVDVAFEAGPLLGGTVEAVHTPGHCPGHVCLRIDDLLLTGDHVLSGISPHLSPEEITLTNGLAHYLEALAKVIALDGVRLGLDGHRGLVDDVAARAVAIRQEHETRLDELLALCTTPRTIVELSKAVFGRVRSYHILLAVLETGALVEYLHQYGGLVVANLDEVQRAPNPPLRYVQS